MRTGNRNQSGMAGTSKNALAGHQERQESTVSIPWHLSENGEFVRDRHILIGPIRLTNFSSFPCLTLISVMSMLTSPPASSEMVPHSQGPSPAIQDHCHLFAHHPSS